MRITKEMFDKFITERYRKWIADTMRCVTNGNKDEAEEIVNDLCEYTYKRIEDKGFISCDNIDGYVYSCARLSKTSDSSPYQRKRGLQYIYIPLCEIFTELKDGGENAEMDDFESENIFEYNLS